MTKKKAKKRKRPKKKKAKKPPAEKPAIETPDVVSEPWPRAGDNKEFEALLGEDQPTPKAQAQAQAGGPGDQEEPRLNVNDVAEWVKWPFYLWSTSQGLKPIITELEAVSVATPLTRILDRHGVSQKIPPDVVDGLQVAGRLMPVIKRGNDQVKQERQRRAAEQGKDAVPGSKGSRHPAPQGAPQTKPVER